MKPSKSIFVVWLCLMVLFVGFIVFFDWYGEVLMLRAREADPANAYEYGMEYLEKGQLKNAAEKLEISLEFAGKDTVRWPAYMLRQARLNLGEIYYQLEEYDKARPYLERLLLTDNAPGLKEGVPLFHLAEVYLKHGEKEKARQTFRMTTEWNFGPGSAVAFFRLAELAADAEDYNAAVRDIDMAVTVDAGETLDAQMWTSAARIAADAVRKTTKENVPLAREILGIAHYRLNDYAACAQDLEEALKGGRDTVRVHYYLWKTYEQLGAHDKAQRHLSAVPRGKVTTRAADMIHTFGEPRGSAWTLTRNGSLRAEVFFASRVSKIEILAKGYVAQFVGTNMVVRLGGHEVGEVEIRDPEFKTYTFEPSVSTERGLLEIMFTNSYRDPDTGEARGLYVINATLVYRDNAEKGLSTSAPQARKASKDPLSIALHTDKGSTNQYPAASHAADQLISPIGQGAGCFVCHTPLGTGAVSLVRGRGGEVLTGNQREGRTPREVLETISKSGPAKALS